MKELLLIVLLAVVFATTPSARCQDAPPFTGPEQTSWDTKLLTEIGHAAGDAKFNQGWDIAFRITLLIVNVGLIICGALIASNNGKAPMWLSVTSAALAGLTTVLAGFAFSEFNFAAREYACSRKAEELKLLREDLMTFGITRDEFRRRYFAVSRWNYRSPSDKLSVEDQSSAAAATPAPK